MRTAIQILIAVTVVAGPCCVFALADGGQVRVMERRGNYQLTVFTSPNPLRAGPVDVSVLVQDAKTGLPIPDVTVAVELKSPDKSLPPIRAAATTDAATNKLLHAALVELPAPGRWDVRVECTTARDRTPIEVSFAMDAAPPLPRWLSVWPWFSWPIVAVLLFGIHRALVHRRQTHRTLGGTPRASSDGRGEHVIASPRPSPSLRDVPPKHALPPFAHTVS